MIQIVYIMFSIFVVVVDVVVIVYKTNIAINATMYAVYVTKTRFVYLSTVIKR